MTVRTLVFVMGYYISLIMGFVSNFIILNLQKKKQAYIYEYDLRLLDAIHISDCNLETEQISMTRKDTRQKLPRQYSTIEHPCQCAYVFVLLQCCGLRLIINLDKT